MRTAALCARDHLGEGGWLSREESSGRQSHSHVRGQTMETTKGVWCCGGAGSCPGLHAVSFYFFRSVVSNLRRLLGFQHLAFIRFPALMVLDFCRLHGLQYLKLIRLPALIIYFSKLQHLSLIRFPALMAPRILALCINYDSSSYSVELQEASGISTPRVY